MVFQVLVAGAVVNEVRVAGLASAPTYAPQMTPSDVVWTPDLCMQFAWHSDPDHPEKITGWATWMPTACYPLVA